MIKYLGVFPLTWLWLLLLLGLCLAHLTGFGPEAIVGIGTFAACPHLAAAMEQHCCLRFIVVASRRSNGATASRD